MKSFHKVLWPHDEASRKFKNALIERNLEVEKVPITPYISKLEVFPTEYKKCYKYIDAGIYFEVEKLLREAGALKGLNDIAFILKKHYYKKILLEINFDSLQEFNSQFYGLYKFLDEDLSAIRFESNRKGEENFKVAHPDLIKAIIHSYKLFLLETGTELITLNELGKQKNTVLLTAIQDEACLQILTCLQTTTSCKFNSTPKDAATGRFSDKMCNLIHELLVEGAIISDTHTESPKAYIRNKIKRSIKKEPNLLEHMTTVKGPFSYDSLFPNGEYIQGLVDTIAKLKRDLKQK